MRHLALFVEIFSHCIPRTGRTRIYFSTLHVKQRRVPFSCLRYIQSIETELVLFRVYQNILDEIEFTLVLIVIDAFIVEKLKKLELFPFIAKLSNRKFENDCTVRGVMC